MPDKIDDAKSLIAAMAAIKDVKIEKNGQVTINSNKSILEKSGKELTPQQKNIAEESKKLTKEQKASAHDLCNAYRNMLGTPVSEEKEQMPVKEVKEVVKRPDEAAYMEQLINKYKKLR